MTTLSKKIQLVDLVSLHERLKPEIDAEMEKVISTASFINGSVVGELECALSKYLGIRFAIGCANGTDALQIALMALGVGRGDEVITTPFTFAATVEAILLVGATPRYVDIDPRTFNLNADALADAITPKTKAIMPVHLYGQAAEIDRIARIACENGLDVIEDNAQSFGATYKGKKVGTFGRVSATSFFPAKNLGAFGDAGALFTDDEELFWKLKMIAQHGAKVRYSHELLGVNSRLDSIQAAVLKVKLNYLDEFNARRRAAADLYDKHLANANLQTPYRDPNGTHIFHQYTILLDEAGRRDELQKFLSARGIPTSVHYPMPLHLQKAFRDERYPKGSLPIAESVAERVLSLPMHTELDEEQIAFIAENVKEFVGRNDESRNSNLSRRA
ncbi:MAG: DegT/DnrJ/EryC1/StrS family aminotransferase [Chloroherpetonaceae bacterium]|nr:DegT/DnrJ/EryC1/StrS family aminotransferase [Chloroherpetonaceae bacterium]MDW8438445.1 DegT/DnrJ/EryC1/StrS family aminotransferase [Chloroherpetonaceae bacterium]